MKNSRLDTLWDLIGLKTLTVVDIGARGDADPRWKLLGERSNLIGFEPDPEECRRLNAEASGRRAAFLPDALSDKAQKLALHLCRSAGTSSCYQPNLDFLRRFPEVERFDILKEISLDARTLDEALEGRAPVDFIKIDTQGSELKIIQGARKRTEEAFGLEVEVEFSPIYEDQPLFAEVDKELRARDFVLFDLRPAYWKRTARPCRGMGQLVFADALYFKDPLASGALPKNPAAALSACVVYGKLDYALELARFFAEKGVYSSKEQALIEASLLALSSPAASWGKVKGAGRLANGMQKLADRLRESAWGRYEKWRF